MRSPEKNIYIFLFICTPMIKKQKIIGLNLCNGFDELILVSSGYFFIFLFFYFNIKLIKDH